MNDALTPKAIVAALDAHIIGQNDAKRAVAVALRNRWRRQQLSRRPARRGDAQEHPDDRPHRLRQDRDSAAASPSSPTRRSSRSRRPNSPRSAMSAATSNRSPATWSRKRSGSKRTAAAMRCEDAAEEAAMERLLDALTGKGASEATRQSFRQRIRDGHLDDSEVEIEVADAPAHAVRNARPPGQIGMINLSDMIGKAMGGAPKKRRKLQGHRRLRRGWSKRKRTSASTRTMSRVSRSPMPRRTASSSSTRSTRSRSATCAAARSAARASSATCCR